MTLSLDNAIVYDIETFPNVFTLQMEMLNDDASCVWEISERRDDRAYLFQWFEHLRVTQTPMIGFNIVHFDYPVIHFIFTNPTCTVAQIYEKAQSIIVSGDRFAHTIWDRDRFAPQIDLFKINHFDNVAKTTSLKALQINMRSKTVVDMPVEIGSRLSPEQIDNLLIPYGKHDTAQTKKFAHFCMKAIEFRLGIIPQLGIDVLNYNDTKIGAKLLEQRIGEDVCYDRSSGRKEKRQTIRHRIPLNDIIFPYIYFNNSEFKRILDWMRAQVLEPADIDDPDGRIRTKGAFQGVKASVGGIDFWFGTGGIHGSVPAQRIIATDEWLIRDIDVASLYPSIAIVNKLAPAHLGEAFTREYANLPKERKEWQKKKGKKCVEANSLKLAANGTYGNSNSPFSVFYDPLYTMTITINGQLLICMLAEWLLTVPTVQIIQANTDGITYRIHASMEPMAAEVCKRWQEYTLLVLEDVNYKRMFIRDVNNYIAEDMDGNLKQKGAYWHPDAFNYADSISEAQPPAWHKDLGNIASVRAAVAAMIHNVDIETFLKLHNNPFDFMCRAKVKREDKLILGECEIQKTSRYYVARDGYPLRKISPSSGPEGAYKRANGVSERQYLEAMNASGWQWVEGICTKNKSKYEPRETSFVAGYKVMECNDVDRFEWDNINYEWYVAEARKLMI